jgi:membrane fusion protein, adhesin transport system
VIASSRNQVIQSPEGGILSEMPVREGSLVKKGQLLARFDKTRTEAGYLKSAAKAAGLLATVARLNAEVFGGKPKFGLELAKYPEFRSNQLALFNKRQDALRDEVETLQKSMVMLQEELDMNLPLLKNGDISKSDKRSLYECRNYLLRYALSPLSQNQERIGVRSWVTRIKVQFAAS